MFTSWHDKFSSSKDRLVAATVRHYYNQRFSDFSHMTEIHLDTRVKTIFAKIELLDEPEPLVVEVRHYRLFQVAGKTMIEVTHIDTSKRWLNIVLAQYFLGRSFEVPAAVRFAL